MLGSNINKENGFKRFKTWLKRNNILHKLKVWLEVVALSVGAIIAIVKFFIEDYLVPMNLPPVIVQSNSLEKVSDNNTICYVKVTFSIQNTGLKKVNVQYMTYTIYGVKYLLRPENNPNSVYSINFSGDRWKYITNEDQRKLTDFMLEDTTVLLSGFEFNMNWVDVGESFTKTMVVPIIKRYNIALMETIIYYSKKELPDDIYQNHFYSDKNKVENLYSYNPFYSGENMDDYINSDTLITAEYGIINSTSKCEVFITDSIK